MIELYYRIWNDIFRACEPYFMHDFLNIRGDNGDKKNFCLSLYKKVFEETIKVLEKNKYNGEIVLPTEIVFDKRNIIDSMDVVKNASCFVKHKIILSDGIIKLANARIAEKSERILLVPIDGIPSFAFGNSDFSMVLILQEKIDDNYHIKNISIFNPIRNDICSLDVSDGCKYNDKKISSDKVLESQEVNIAFVNDGSSVMNFDLTKLSQMTNNLFVSKSIFSSLSEMLTTKRNMCIYKINPKILPFVEFICNIALFKYKIIGEHLLIEKNK